jgi:hypothetical protein
MNKTTRMAVFVAVLALVMLLFQGIGFAFYDDEQTMEKYNPLVGKTSKAQLYKACPAFQKNAKLYHANKEAIKELRDVKDKITVITVLGTWSANSQKEAGAFLKIIDEAKNPKVSVTIFAVDEKMQAKDNIAMRFKVDTLPTMIFLKNGKELGRIVQEPKTTMEGEMLAIMKPKGA